MRDDQIYDFLNCDCERILNCMRWSCAHILNNKSQVTTCPTLSTHFHSKVQMSSLWHNHEVTLIIKMIELNKINTYLSLKYIRD